MGHGRSRPQGPTWGDKIAAFGPPVLGMSWNRAVPFQNRSIPFHIRGVGKGTGTVWRSDFRAHRNPIRARSATSLVDRPFVPDAASQSFCQRPLFPISVVYVYRLTYTHACKICRLNSQVFLRPLEARCSPSMRPFLCPIGHIQGFSRGTVSIFAHAFFVNRYCATWP